MAKKALLAGINHYDYPGLPELRGSLNDVTNVRNILKSNLGFRNEEIRVLADDRATKANILYRLNWLVRGAKAEDTLVFYFAGLGSQFRLRDGDDLRDHLDEVLCAYGMNWDNGFITTEEVHDIVKKLPEGVLLEVILDAGFSDVSGVDASGWRPEKSVQSRFLHPPVDVQARSEGEEDELDATRTFSAIVRDISGAALWTGSQDQVAAEEANMGGILSGAFTYYLCRQLRETNGQLSRHDTLNRVRQSLRHNGFTQTSQLQSAVNLKSLKTLSLEEIEIAAATRAEIGGAISKEAREKVAQFPGRATSMKVA